MNLVKYLFISLTILFLSACNNQADLSEDSICKYYDSSAIEQANWFLGTWNSKTTNGNLTETWKQMNDSVYVGESYVIVKTDTLFYESIRLMKKNKKWNYVVAVKNQNNEQPVSFEMTRLTPTQLVFANPTHDFPSTISYTQITQDSMMAEISGLIKGKKQSQHFYMKRFN